MRYQRETTLVFSSHDRRPLRSPLTSICWIHGDERVRAPSHSHVCDGTFSGKIPEWSACRTEGPQHRRNFVPDVPGTKLQQKQTIVVDLQPIADDLLSSSSSRRFRSLSL